LISLVAALAGLLAAEAGADAQAVTPTPQLIQPPASQRLGEPQRIGEPPRIDLKDAKDGTGDLVYETSGFTARIAPDGSVAFKDKRVSGLSQLPWLPMRDAPTAVPSLQASVKNLLKGRGPPAPPPSDLDQGLAPPETRQVIPEVSRYLVDTRDGCRSNYCTNFMDFVLPVNALGRFDVSDELTRFSGQDPSRFQKATFLAATRDQRLQMAVKMHAANIRRADAELPIQLQAIACDTRLAHKERRAILVSLAMEMDPNTPVGANATASITAFLQRFDAGDVSCGAGR
jgi:hypothetical protein